MAKIFQQPNLTKSVLLRASEYRMQTLFKKSFSWPQGTSKWIFLRKYDLSFFHTLYKHSLYYAYVKMENISDIFFKRADHDSIPNFLR